MKLSQTFTRWLNDRTQPGYLAEARVIPLSKEETAYPSYGAVRTISILPIISKIYEKVIHERLKNNVKEQGGFNP